MSRSKKKHPIVGICIVDAKEHAKAKKQMSSRTRSWINDQEGLPNGSVYKKFLHDYSWRPDDGRQRWDDPKAYRK